MNTRIRPSCLTRCFGCKICGLWFAAENAQEAAKWYGRNHIPYCPGQDYYRKKLAA